MPKKVTSVDARLIEWATPRQKDYIEAINRHGGMRAAARSLGMKHQALSTAVASLKRRAARSGYSPAHDMIHVVPEPFHVKGVSTYYGRDGKPRGQWVKSQKNREYEWEVFKEQIECISEPFRGRSCIPATRPNDLSKSVLPTYVIGDHHLGMLSWPEETGGDWNVDLAESLLCDAVDNMVVISTPSEECLIVNVGDFYHADNAKAVTPASGNPLDVDTRWPRMFRLGIRTMKRVIESALTRHARVIVWNVPGNHDPHLSYALSVALAEYYDNDPRVEIDLTPRSRFYREFGIWLIASTHGNDQKMSDLPLLMAAEEPQAWGRTQKRIWLTGHIHHKQGEEHPGCMVESFNVLPPADAWHAKKGYKSSRSFTCIEFDHDYDEETRHVIGIKRLTGSRSRAA